MRTGRVLRPSTAPPPEADRSGSVAGDPARRWPAGREPSSWLPRWWSRPPVMKRTGSRAGSPMNLLVAAACRSRLLPAVQGPAARGPCTAPYDLCRSTRPSIGWRRPCAAGRLYVDARRRHNANDTVGRAHDNLMIQSNAEVPAPRRREKCCWGRPGPAVIALTDERPPWAPLFHQPAATRHPTATLPASLTPPMRLHPGHPASTG